MSYEIEPSISVQNDSGFVSLQPSSGIPDDAARELASNFVLDDVGAGFIRDPYPVYAALRRHNPICRQPDGSYFVSR